VLFIRGKARRDRVRPAYLLQARRDLGVIQIRIVTALTADEFERACVSAFRPAIHDQDLLSAQNRRVTVTELTSLRGRNHTRGNHLQPRVRGIRRAARGTRTIQKASL
jgi:hypothetical protein